MRQRARRRSGVGLRGRRGAGRRTGGWDEVFVLFRRSGLRRRRDGSVWRGCRERSERGQRGFHPITIACMRSTYPRLECEWRAPCWWRECVPSAGPGPPACDPGGGGGSGWALRLNLQTAQHKEQLIFNVLVSSVSSPERNKYDLVLTTLQCPAGACSMFSDTCRRFSLPQCQFTELHPQCFE